MLECNKVKFTLTKAISPDEVHSFWHQISEGGAVDNGILPFTVLNDIIRQIEEIESV